MRDSGHRRHWPPTESRPVPRFLPFPGIRYRAAATSTDGERSTLRRDRTRGARCAGGPRPPQRGAPDPPRQLRRRGRATLGAVAAPTACSSPTTRPRSRLPDGLHRRRRRARSAPPACSARSALDDDGSGVHAPRAHAAEGQERPARAAARHPGEPRPDLGPVARRRPVGAARHRDAPTRSPTRRPTRTCSTSSFGGRRPRRVAAIARRGRQQRRSCSPTATTASRPPATTGRAARRGDRRSGRRRDHDAGRRARRRPAVRARRSTACSPGVGGDVDLRGRARRAVHRARRRPQRARRRRRARDRHARAAAGSGWSTATASRCSLPTAELDARHGRAPGRAARRRLGPLRRRRCCPAVPGVTLAYRNDARDGRRAGGEGRRRRRGAAAPGQRRARSAPPRPRACACRRRRRSSRRSRAPAWCSAASTTRQLTVRQSG